MLDVSTTWKVMSKRLSFEWPLLVFLRMMNQKYSLSFLFCLFQWKVFGSWSWVARYFLPFVQCSCSWAVEGALNLNRFKVTRIRATMTNLRRFTGANLFPEDNKTQETSKTFLSYNGNYVYLTSVKNYTLDCVQTLFYTELQNNHDTYTCTIDDVIGEKPCHLATLLIKKVKLRAQICWSGRVWKSREWWILFMLHSTFLYDTLIPKL